MLLQPGRKRGVVQDNMSHSRESQSELHTQNERLARSFYTNGRYYPHFFGIAGLGFFVIYILTRFGIFGEPAPQLLYIGALTFILALCQIALLSLARRNRGIAANLLGMAAIGIFTVLLTYLWQGVLPISLLILLITPVTALRYGLPRRDLAVLLLIAGAAMIATIYVDGRSAPFDRLQNSSPAAIAALAFLLATGLLLVTITAVSGNTRFRSLRTLLLTSFIVIVTIPTIMAAALSAIGAFTTTQEQTFSTLKAISQLKEDQVITLIQDLQNDANKLRDDSVFSLNALDMLTARQATRAQEENSKRLVRLSVQDTLGTEGDQYAEVLVLNNQGNVLISTVRQNEGMNFEDQLFFRQGTLRFYTGFAEVPAFGDQNLIVATPIYDTDGRVIRGVLVLRSNANSIKSVMENTVGFETAETYLVDKDYKPVTKTRTSTNLISTQASLEAILNNTGGAQSIYDNYEGKRVLGYYTWLDPMQVALISEVPLSFVIANSTRALVGSAILALFVISIAIAAVTFSARSITHPITVLAQTTESFAAGKLSARAHVDRADEIGALANSYNQMASQLQEIIGRLEQRVQERTRDLERQTLRLRVAAEIARDAASARQLGDLLERSASLIQDRFGIYHSGIFLIDSSREYAVLAAASSATGKQMIESNYKLRVGEEGIVGHVAASGEPRIAHINGNEANPFNDPDLPNTRSEMALPLKAERSVIGVLDLQSDEPDTFREEDIAILQIMADQLATAIERTRLLQEVESSLTELKNAYGESTRENWRILSTDGQSGSKGYRFDNIRIEAISELPELGKSAFETGITTSSNGQSPDRQTSVAVPVKLRGQAIGVINLKLKENYGENTISTIELASERLAAALESARLYEEARLRADREQSIAQVTSAISASTNYEEILQTTIREIGSTIRDAEISIQITGDTDDNHSNG